MLQRLQLSLHASLSRQLPPSLPFSSTLALAALSGVLCSLSFPNWDDLYLEPLAWIALVPLLWALEQGRSLWRASASFALAFQLSNLAALAMLKGPWVLMLMINAPGLMAFALLYGCLRRRLSMGWALAVWVPAAVVAEFIHLTTWPPNAPWWLLGASQARLTPVIQVSAWTGPWGLTAWLLLVNALTLMTWHTKRRRWLGVLIACLLVPWIGGTWVLTQPAVDNAPDLPVLSVATVSTGIPTNRETDRVALAMQISEPVAQTQPDLIAWPEGVSVPGLPDASGIVKPIQNRVDAWQTPLLLAGVNFQEFPRGAHTPNSPVPTPFELASGAAYRAQSGNMVLVPTLGDELSKPFFQAKRHMVPFQEFMPWADTWPHLMTRLSPFSLHGRTHWFTPSSTPTIPFDIPAQGRVVSVGATLCFELLFPDAVAQLAAAGAQMLVWQTNDEDAKQGVYAYQMAQFARLRAVETRREIVRVNTDGHNFHVDSHGRMSPFGPQGSGHMTFNISTHNDLTLYVRYPHAFVLLCAAGSLCLALLGVYICHRYVPRRLSSSDGAPLL